ncbi:hypothetical protein PF003_g8349 [Phytophthora fragariae]|nr:hypothetical protein PF003_g8349 [Phytophthora fragariae]
MQPAGHGLQRSGSSGCSSPLRVCNADDATLPRVVHESPASSGYGARRLGARRALPADVALKKCVF